MRRLALVLSLSAASVVAGAAYAQPGPEITVTSGTLLDSKANSYGPREIGLLKDELRKTVAAALAGGPAVQRVDLVIEDAQPNRPTFAQLGHTVGLSFDSTGIGGARISGRIVGPDGVARPLRYQWYETDLRNERGVTPWYDAERAFDDVAREIRSGRLTNGYTGPGPSRDGGKFGDRSF